MARRNRSHRRPFTSLVVVMIAAVVTAVVGAVTVPAAAESARSVAASATVSPWVSLGGVITSGPSAVTWGVGREEVFARGADYQLWHKWYEAGAWSDWQPLGGLLASDPEVIALTSPGTTQFTGLRVYVTGFDGNVWVREYSQGFFGARWGDWYLYGAPPQTTVVGGPVGLAHIGFGHLLAGTDEVVLVRGADNQLWIQGYSSGLNVGYINAPWTPCGGVITSDPDLTRAGEFFARGSDMALYQGRFQFVANVGLTCGWQQQSLGGILSSGPGAVSLMDPNTGVVEGTEVFVRGADGALWHRGQQGWESLGGVLLSDPDVASLGDLQVFVRGADNQLWFINYSDS
jgi:hypothetical protein